jgi:GT2 family glycosyltransferase
MRPRHGFTVVIAARNAELTIANAIRSVRDQVDEIVLVDDCSSDRTLEIAREAGGDRLRVLLRSFHGPLGVTRQVGLLQIETQWAGWLDADDVYLDGRVERLVRRLERGEVTAVADATILEDERTREQRTVPLPVWTSQSTLPARLFERNPLPAIGLIGFRAETWRRIGYDPTFHGAEDVDLALRAIAGGVRFGWIEEPGTRVTVRQASLSHQRENQRRMYCRALRKHSYDAVRALYVEAGWNEATTSWGLASMAMFREEPLEALAFLEEAARCGMSGWPIAFARGTALLLKGDTEAAVAVLRAAESIAPTPECANNLGVAFARAGRAAAARRWFETALDRHSGFHDPAANLTADGALRITTHALR